MTAADPYAVLGVRPDAGHDEIRRAWVALVRRHHPDLGGDPAALRAVNDAWAVLGDPVRRRQWDRGRGVNVDRDPRPVDADLGDLGNLDLDLDPVPLLPERRSPIDLAPMALFAGAIATGSMALALDAPGLLAMAAFLFFLSCIAVAAVALLAMRRSVRAGRR